MKTEFKLLVTAGAVLSAWSLFAGTMNPISVTGWEEDIVIGIGESYSTGSTAQMDNESGGSGATVWYEYGRYSSYPTSGLTTNLIQSETTSDLYFQLQPFGSAEGTVNNALYEGGTLTLTAAAAYDRIALIGATGQGTANLTIRFIYTDESETVFSNLGSSNSINQDWFNGSGIAYTAHGRISTVSGSYEYAGTSNPRLYENIFDIDETRLLQTIIVTDNANLDPQQHNVIMAVSGEAIPEPATMGLISGIVAVLFFYRRFFLD